MPPELAPGFAVTVVALCCLVAYACCVVAKDDGSEG